ncbi:MAG: molybdopterin-dependent oxidoreductase [Bacteroidales bacterium]|nr:molybdopterin-dependent oxidoreductase [Bacteroidales bacterium]
MPTFKTTCARDCYDSCGMIVEADDNQNIISVKGDINHPITKGFLCPRGTKDNIRLHNNRVNEPNTLINQKHTVVDWNTAIKEVATKLQQTINEYGKQSVLYLDYAGNEGLINNIFAKRLWNFLSVTQTDGALCTATGHNALNLHYGNSYGIQPTLLPNKKLIVFWGFNPIVTAPHFWRLSLEARKKNNAKIIVIDPIRTASAKKADVFLQIKAGTDTSLAYQIINLLISNNKHDSNFIKNQTIGFEKLKQKSNEFLLKNTAELTNISEKNIIELANFYAQDKLSATMIGVSLQKRNEGAEPIRAISFIPAILGLERGFFYSNSRALNINTSIIAGDFLSKNKKIVSQVNLSELVYRNKFKFIFVNSTNPVKTLPNPSKFIEGLKKNDIYIAVNETHWSETAKIANVVFPVPTFFEKEDVMLSWGHNYTRISEKCSKKITNSKTEVEIMTLLAQEIGISNKHIFTSAMKVIEKEFENQSLNEKKLKSGNLVELKIKKNSFYNTPSKKIEFYSLPAEKSGLSPLPKQPDIIKNSFVLITSAVARYTNTQFKEVYGKFEHSIYINYDDAKELSINDNDKVILENENARLIFTAKISSDIAKKVIWAQRQIDDINGESINNLTTAKAQDFGKGPKFNSTLVKIFKT